MTLHIDASTSAQSNSRACDLTWFHLSMSFLEKCGFAYAINIDAVVVIVDFIVVIMLITLIAL